MRIALVVHDLHEHGGHSLYTRILADQLSPQNDVTVFANRCERPGDARWRYAHVKTWRANALTTVRTFPIGLKAQTNRLKEFDIQHAQGYCGGRPNVVTAHRCMASYIRSLSTVSLRHRFSHRVMLQAESQFYRNFDGTVIAISRQVADELQEAYNVSGAIKVVHHGVDSQRFRKANRKLYRFELRKQLGIGEVKTVALYVGDLTKSHVHLKKLSRILPEITFLVVSASKAYRWNASNVRFIPHSRKIEQYYAAADVFVFPSENDPFGMVVLEAMASGLPVFCSDQAGVSELITSDKDGFVFSLDDWLEATATHLRDVDSLQRIGAEAELTAHRHDWDTVVRKVEQVYVDVASREAAITAPQLRNSAYRYQQ